jgi:hypothetical protein
VTVDGLLDSYQRALSSSEQVTVDVMTSDAVPALAPAFSAVPHR